MSAKVKSYSFRILRTLLVVTLLLLAVHFVFQYLNLQVYNQQNGQIYELSNRFDMDDEASVPTWFAQALFLLISLVCSFASRVQSAKSLRRFWGLAAVISLLFSIDEVAGLHERLLQTIHVFLYQDARPTSSDNSWLFVAPFILAVGGYLLWWAYKLLPRRTLMLMVISGLVFVSGAVMVDMLTSVADRETFFNQGILVALEEMMELLGAILGLYAITDYLERQHSESVNRLKQLTARN